MRVDDREAYSIRDTMEVEPTQRGEKREGKDEDSSPSKKRDGGELTVASVQRLLQMQTQEIRQQTAMEIDKAIHKLEASTLKHIQEVRQDISTIQHQVSQQESKIDDIRRDQTDLASRVAQLEAKGSPASTSVGAAERRLGIVIGGWHPESRRDDIVRNVQGVVKALNIAALLDEDAFRPGVRRGIAIANLEQRQGECFLDTKKRMIQILRKINEAKLTGHGVQQGQTVWASTNKNAQERERSSHASKTRKLIHTIAPELITKAETEHSTGTLWLGDQMISSATRPKPKNEKTCAGRVATAWFSPTRFSKVSNIEVAQVEAKWREIMED